VVAPSWWSKEVVAYAGMGEDFSACSEGESDEGLHIGEGEERPRKREWG
jgi:hypothetical protein